MHGIILNTIKLRENCRAKCNNVYVGDIFKMGARSMWKKKDASGCSFLPWIRCLFLVQLTQKPFQFSHITSSLWVIKPGSLSKHPWLLILNWHFVVVMYTDYKSPKQICAYFGRFDELDEAWCYEKSYTLWEFDMVVIIENEVGTIVFRCRFCET